jgi:hypothetical protein
VAKYDAEKGLLGSWFRSPRQGQLHVNLLSLRQLLWNWGLDTTGIGGLWISSTFEFKKGRLILSITIACGDSNPVFHTRALTQQYFQNLPIHVAIARTCQLVARNLMAGYQQQTWCAKNGRFKLLQLLRNKHHSRGRWTEGRCLALIPKEESGLKRWNKSPLHPIGWVQAKNCQ